MRISTALALVLLGACKPASVTDAEAKGDVKYLTAQGTPESVAALGRLADKNPAALKALDARADTDMNVYSAAWQATLRDAAWGPTTLRAGLSDPARVELAAIAMARKDPHLEAFAADLDGALRLVAADTRAVSTPAVLASAGKAAQPFIEQRLADPKTREPMCRGLASPDASPDSRATFMRVPAASRDGQSCLRAAVQMAKTDDEELAWMGTTAEPGLLTAAGKEDSMPCARLEVAWKRALTERPAERRAQLTLPLAAALTRCSKELDHDLAAALDRGEFYAVIVDAMDPVDPRDSALKATCARLPFVAKSNKVDGRVRGRAGDELTQACTWD